MSLPKTMKAINLPQSSTFTTPAKGADLILNPKHPTPIPSANNLLICVHAVALTPFELTWPIYALPKPHIPCQDIAGTIISAPASSGFREGDKVFGLLGLDTQGGMAEYVAADPRFFAIVPAELGWEEAARLPRAVLTAWQAVRVRGGGLVKCGARVLVTGAMGAVGRMVVQVVRGVVAVGGVGSEGLRGLGADVVVNYREIGDWEDVVRNEGLIDVVVDVVITLGSPAPVWENVKGWKEAQERGAKGLFFIVEANGEQLEGIAGLVQKGAIKPSVSMATDGLTESGFRDGWTKAGRGCLFGSVVVKVL